MYVPIVRFSKNIAIACFDAAQHKPREYSNHKKIVKWEIDETATLLNARGIGHLAGIFFNAVNASHACRIEWMDRDRFLKTQAFFEKHLDHSWSFTDCFSFIIMKELKLRDALTKNKRFKEAGFTPLLWHIERC